MDRLYPASKNRVTTFFTIYIRLVICFSLLVSGYTATAQMRQIYQDTFQTDNHLYKFSFYTPSEGYVAFTKFIGYTTDSGRSYVKKYITSGNVDYGTYSVNLTFGFTIEGVHAFNKDTLVVYGDYGFVPAILFSTNQGNSFKLVFHSQYNPGLLSGAVKSAVFPGNGSTGFAVDADRILKTINKGLNWTVARVVQDGFLDRLEAVNSLNVIAFSTTHTSGKILRTTDGINWNNMIPPVSTAVYYAKFISATKGWLNQAYTYGPKALFYTSNGGVSWSPKTNVDIAEFQAEQFNFINDSVGYAIAGVTVYKTTDSGKIWEPLQRNNNFAYLGYGHNDLFFYNNTQFWAGGGKGFTEITTNGGGTPLPKAFCKVDTAGSAATGQVQLRNYSKTNYQYKWVKNGTLISTAYHASYTRNVNQLKDTIQLIVINGTGLDTVTRYAFFSPPVVVTSFSPQQADAGTLIKITGRNFLNASRVMFGNVNASYFRAVSDTLIEAYITNAGAAGDVTVFTASSFSSKPGFTGYPYPAPNLPFTISDTTLCKGEPINISIQNTELNVRYDLIDSLGASFGNVISTGGTINFSSIVLTKSGSYRIKATRPGSYYNTIFTLKRNILVERTKSVFFADVINAPVGQAITYKQQSLEATSFAWTFNQDASTVSSMLATPPLVTYSTPGQKTVRLISTSSYGCADTAFGDGVYAFIKSMPDATCYVQNVQDTNYAWAGYSTTTFNQVSLSTDDGYIISGQGHKPLLKSKIGAARKIPFDNTAYVAKYTTDGLLSWVNYISGNGKITATATDSDGNIYIGGIISDRKYFVFNNGDSMRLYVPPDEYTYEISEGFIMKLDAAGKYLWHTMVYDPGPYNYSNNGRPGGELISKIAIRNNHIMVLGNFSRKLAYSRTGMRQILFDFFARSTNTSTQNSFIIKIKNDGALVWKASALNNSNNRHKLADLSIDKEGNSYLAGFYEYNVKMYDVDSVERVNLSATVGNYRSYLVKYDSTGHINWHNYFRTSYAYGQVTFEAIDTDSAGNCYVTGRTNTPINESIIASQQNGADRIDSLSGYVLYKFDKNGKYKWAVGSRYAEYGGGSSICINNNKIYTTGYLHKSGEWYAGFSLTSTNGISRMISSQMADFFITAYDTSGVLKQVEKSGLNQFVNATIITNKILVNTKDQFIVSGVRSGNTTSSPVVFNSPLFAVSEDGFIAKVNPNFCSNGITTLCSGGAGTLTAGTTGSSYQWQVDTGIGSFINITNNSNYAGVTTGVLQLTSAPATWYGYKYRCVVDNIPGVLVHTIQFENYFTGQVNNSWNNPGNWTCGRVPDANTDVVVSTYIVIVNSNAVCRTLTISQGSTVRVATPYTLTILR